MGDAGGAQPGSNGASPACEQGSGEQGKEALLLSGVEGVGQQEQAAKSWGSCENVMAGSPSLDELW